jgi:hypothetical protein
MNSFVPGTDLKSGALGLYTIFSKNHKGAGAIIYDNRINISFELTFGPGI